ncbi:rna-directed dna polymerase from mobile element jockey-like [Willisornis vidua]|uniref:Rna-directed dna polymerase from mobile element jockey-like n=1 Tax=Willisornis vidua TaxID=1566151 RepID=A0ABQ9CQM1_9PASS|nr:rna-directed dna polymerase from mobile element jockey-like [Willisornis vidua]
MLKETQHFLISLSVTNSASKCTLNKFANDTKICGVVNTLERRDDIQRDLDTLERRACANLMKINKAKCKVLDGANPKKKNVLGRENWGKDYSWGEELVPGCRQKAQYDPAICTCSPEDKSNLGFHQQKHEQQIHSKLFLLKLPSPPLPMGMMNQEDLSALSWMTKDVRMTNIQLTLKLLGDLLLQMGSYKGLADIIRQHLSMIFEQSWESRQTPAD